MNTIKDILRESIEEFAKISIFNENPIEHNGEQVDGSFYQVYKGNFENWLKAHDQKLLQAVVQEIIEKKRKCSHGDYSCGKYISCLTHTTTNKMLADLIASITPTE